MFSHLTTTTDKGSTVLLFYCSSCFLLFHQAPTVCVEVSKLILSFSQFHFPSCKCLVYLCASVSSATTDVISGTMWTRFSSKYRQLCLQNKYSVDIYCEKYGKSPGFSNLAWVGPSLGKLRARHTSWINNQASCREAITLGMYQQKWENTGQIATWRTDSHLADSGNKPGCSEDGQTVAHWTNIRVINVN